MSRQVWRASVPPDGGHGRREGTFDGIEVDRRPTPRPWLVAFAVTVIVATVYLFASAVGWLGSRELELRASLLELSRLRASAPPPPPPVVTEEMLREASAHQANIAAGAELFETECAHCHGPAGKGQIGPNLGDDVWLYGAGELTDIHHLISEGVPPKAMPAWGKVLEPHELVELTVYVRSLGHSPVKDGR